MRVGWLVVVGLGFGCTVSRSNEGAGSTGGEAQQGGKAGNNASGATSKGGTNGGGGSSGGAAASASGGEVASGGATPGGGAAGIQGGGSDGGFLSTGGTAGAGPDCSGCRIGTECVAAGTRNPDNACEICDPSRSARAWASDDGRSCDDGLFCTTGDVCKAGACKGTARGCDDTIACNGVATCDEATKSCKDGASKCAGDICDLVSDRCVPTCTGCLIAGQCVPSGRESPQNPCLVCEPTVSTTAYSAKVGKLCGSAADACSKQDTCDAQGVCQPNHEAVGKACGDSTDKPCNAPDTCDGKGDCLPNAAANGTTCDDGQYCSAESRCQGGTCVATTARSCAANERCDETSDSCTCTGCKIGSSCVASGAKNPNNPCQVCNPTASAVAYSANTGANCGSAATECSAQDTCNASGSCQANHLTDGATCSTGECVSGACQALQNPFDCVVPSPPTAALPMDVYYAPGNPPTARGGTIAAGKYVPSRIDMYTSATVSTISVRTFEFSKKFTQVAMRPFSPESGAAWIPQIEFAGTFATSGSQITFTVDRCDPSYNIDVPSLMYTASANGLTTIEPLNDGMGTWVVTSFVRQ